MKHLLPHAPGMPGKRRLTYFLFPLVLFAFLFSGLPGRAQGTWTTITQPAPGSGSGDALTLMSDGSVLTNRRSYHAGSSIQNGWSRLRPDAFGSYAHGTWDTIAVMHDTRLFFSSQLLRNGYLYIAGGEYGSGGAKAEVYNPLTNVWTETSPLPAGYGIVDQSSEMLADGRVLQGVYMDTLLPPSYGLKTAIYDPATNAFTPGPARLNSDGEASWVKLPDNSVLFVDWTLTTSERYIPATNTWIADATAPVNIYDSVANESGPALLLPDGRVFLIGGNGKTLFYTPSGAISPGSWTAGPDVPNDLGIPDGSASVMPNGRVLLVASPQPNLFNVAPSPVYFFEFDYTTNTYLEVPAPMGGDTLSAPAENISMLNLPDGNILVSMAVWSQYYLYTPSGAPLAAGKPTVDKIVQLSCDTFIATGKLFNGLNEGSYYGDDAQLATNYPIIRLSDTAGVYYTRTCNWNHTCVANASLEDTTYFTIPAGLAEGGYSLQVIANGNPSDTVLFKTCHVAEVPQAPPTIQVP